MFRKYQCSAIYFGESIFFKIAFSGQIRVILTLIETWEKIECYRFFFKIQRKEKRKKYF